jgi:hypothetical protein
VAVALVVQQPMLVQPAQQHAVQILQMPQMATSLLVVNASHSMLLVSVD